MTHSTYDVVSIEAWRYPEGWTWNASYNLDSDVVIADDASTRALLKLCRNRGYLSDRSKGRVRVEDCGDLIEIQARGTGEPLIAFIRQHGDC